VSGNLHYLQKLQPALKQLCGELPQLRLKIVSNEFIDLDGVPTIKEKWALGTEIDSLRSFDIGIMPLDDTLWARGKCGYKILQYMGVGVPAVASPVGINAEIVEHGVTGLHATTEDKWLQALSHLARDAEKRHAMGLAARAAVEKDYSLQQFAARYIEIFQSVAAL
jgi:glycosyltransferase involved in cell wall biosynthesis